MVIRVKSILGLVFCLSLMASYVVAKTSQQTATGVAEGYSQALAAALFNAVQQANGAKLRQIQVLKAELEEEVTEQQNRTTTESKWELGVQDRVVTTGTKYVESYQVTNVKQPGGDSKLWEVTVSAAIPEYESLIKDEGKPSIAVMPFRFSHPTFAFHDGQPSSNAFQLSGRIKDKLISALTQTQYFIVVSRADNSALSKEFLTEAALLNSEAVTASEASRFGNVVGTDYMMTGRINQLKSDVEVNTFYGMEKEKTTDYIDVSFQVVEVATQKILWADTITEEFEREEDDRVNVTLDHVAQLVIDSTMGHLDPEYVAPQKNTRQPEPREVKEVRETPGSSEAPVKWD